ncbi:MAG: amidohydrolase family protein [Blastocatellia bacterium]
MKSKLLLPVFAAIGSLLSISAEAQTYAITNARIVTVSGTQIEKGTVVIRDGLIESVGASVTAPADAQVFDGTGLTVYPGLIDIVTSAGFQARPATPAGPGGGATASQQPTAASNSNYPAGLRPEETAAGELRAGEAQFEATRNAGFTTVLTVGRTGIFNGQSALINLAGDSTSSMIIKSPVALHVSFATVPGGGYPGSLLGTFSAMRQMFYDAQRLQEMQKQYAANPRGMKRPDADKSLEALFPALNGQMPVVFNANRENEIVRALDFAKEFNLRIMIAGGQEAAKTIDRLKAQDVPVLLSLNLPKRTTAASPDADPESLNILRFRAEAPKTAGKLAQAGVKFAFQSGGLANVNDFLTNSQQVIDGGLNRDAALRAMTLGAAEILGVADRTGSVEAGKMANLIVVRGDIFNKEKVITHVFVDGKHFEQKPPAPRPAQRPGDTASSALPSVGGNYSITIDAPGQSLVGTLNLTQQGSTLTGTMVTQAGTIEIKGGRVTPEGLSFAGTIEFGGLSIDFTVRASVTGNQLSGTVDSPQGTAPITGTRNP